MSVSRDGVSLRLPITVRVAVLPFVIFRQQLLPFSSMSHCSPRQRLSSKVEELRFIAALAAQMLRGALARRESAHKRSDASAHAAVGGLERYAVVAHTCADEETMAAAVEA